MNTKELLKKLQPLIALFVLVVALSLLSDKFLTFANQRNILLQISANLCLSIGMTLVILTGGIDLSVGAILALSGAVAAGLLKNGLALKMFGVVLQFTPFGAVVAGIFTGLALGWFNGFAIKKFKLPPFVATLGMLSIGRGLTMLWTGGFPVTSLGATFGFIGAGIFLGVPMPVWISAALVVVFYFVSRRTTLGRYIYAVGGNEKASAGRERDRQPNGRPQRIPPADPVAEPECLVLGDAESRDGGQIGRQRGEMPNHCRIPQRTGNPGAGSVRVRYGFQCRERL